MQPCNRRRPSSRLQDNKVRQMFWGIEVCLGSPDLGGGGGAGHLAWGRVTWILGTWNALARDGVWDDNLISWLLHQLLPVTLM